MNYINNYSKFLKENGLINKQQQFINQYKKCNNILNINEFTYEHLKNISPKGKIFYQ
jgi:hypothetical protein